jgi:hypothetical protein
LPAGFRWQWVDRRLARAGRDEQEGFGIQAGERLHLVVEEAPTKFAERCVARFRPPRVTLYCRDST